MSKNLWKKDLTTKANHSSHKRLFQEEEILAQDREAGEMYPSLNMCIP